MGVDAVYVSDAKKYYIISDAEYDLLYPAIEQLKKRSGMYIDRYGDVKRVHPDHLRILVEHAALSKHGGKLDALLGFLSQAIAEQESMNFFGD